MNLPKETSSSWTHLVYAAYTLACLTAWAEFTDLSESARTVLNQMAGVLRTAIDNLLREARGTQDLTLFVRPSVQAAQQSWLTLARRRLAEAVSTVAVRVGGGSKDHPAVREFLPGLTAGVNEAPIAERVLLLSSASDRLAKLGAEFPEKAALVTKLAEASEGLQRVLAANEAAWVTFRRERSEEVVAKGRLRLELERLHGRLQGEFPGQREFVESFFLRNGRASEDAGEEAEDAPASEPVPAPTPVTPA